ncbi:MAG: preprotein translocase subunit YajC [Desulfarculus sp.]|jgi:preprotein translocase subunit YajC|nr:MAG: preprotein translocase subunit YajC [Desulfarculus sp.]
MLDLFHAGVAWALGTGQQAAGKAGESSGGLGGLLSGPIPMLVLMFVIFYFLLIRPQQKKAKAHREMLSSIKKGDQVITGGGIYGRVTGVDDQSLVVEIAPQVRVKINRANVAGLASGAPAQAPAKKK